MHMYQSNPHEISLLRQKYLPFLINSFAFEIIFSIKLFKKFLSLIWIIFILAFTLRYYANCK